MDVHDHLGKIKNPVLFFDGVCNICNSTIQFILQKERNHDLRFSPLQSILGQKVMEKLPPDTDSLVLLQDGEIYTLSSAALKVSGYLKFPWSLLRYLQVVPTFLRDPIYRLIAHHRYRIFGKKSSCMLPSPPIAQRFL